jgi:hypothetical protein
VTNVAGNLNSPTTVCLIHPQLFEPLILSSSFQSNWSVFAMISSSSSSPLL